MEEPLTRKEFQKWIENDYDHLAHDVKYLKLSVSAIGGKLSVLIPLTIAILAMLVTILVLVL